MTFRYALPWFHQYTVRDGGRRLLRVPSGYVFWFPEWMRAYIERLIRVQGRPAPEVVRWLAINDQASVDEGDAAIYYYDQDEDDLAVAPLLGFDAEG